MLDSGKMFQSENEAKYLLYILMRPLDLIFSPFFSQLIWGVGTPSAWQTKRAVPARGRVKLSGDSTIEGGAWRKKPKNIQVFKSFSFFPVSLHWQPNCSTSLPNTVTLADATV